MINRFELAILALIAMVALVATVAPPLKAQEKKQVSGEAKTDKSGAGIFKQYCASCHAAGGNIVKPARPLAGSTKLAALATFKAYLQNPPGHMPYYQNVVTDQALLKSLYDYCKSLKKESAPKKVALMNASEFTSKTP